MPTHFDFQAYLAQWGPITHPTLHTKVSVLPTDKSGSHNVRHGHASHHPPSWSLNRPFPATSDVSSHSVPTVKQSTLPTRDIYRSRE